MSYAQERKTLELINKLLPYLAELDAFYHGATCFHEVLSAYRSFLCNPYRDDDDDIDDLDNKLFSEEFQTALKKEMKAVLRKVESKFELKTKKIRVEHTYLEEKKK